MQREARFVDFVQEDVASYSDAEIGAATRVVHAGCRKLLREHFSIAPVRTEAEGSRVTVPAGFDASAVRLSGNVVGTAPFFARLVENVLREVDRGVIEACQAMGIRTSRIIFGALLPEALPGLIAAVTVTAITLMSYAAMSGVIGGGGLGDLAIRFGYQRFQTEVMVITVALLVVLVQIIQYSGDRLVLYFTRK